MNTKQKLSEALGQFIDAVASGDAEAEQLSMKAYITDKSKVTLESDSDSKIKLDGDDVLLLGKKIGSIVTDVEAENATIQFESESGEHNGEFASLEELYSHITEKYNVSEDAINEDESVDEGKADVVPAVGKQEHGRTERLKRLADSKKLSNKDGKGGEYDGGTNVDMSTDAAHPGDGIVSDREKKGYYDKADPRSNHKDPIKGGSAPAHAGGEADLKTDAKYDAHDVRKEHSKGAQK